MPELPEVETVARELRPHLIGRQITKATVYWPRSIACPSAEEFSKLVCGRRILNVARRGKYLLFPLADGWTLLIHLRMTGNLHVQPTEHPLNRHTRVILSLDDGYTLRFTDQRKFGRLWLTQTPEAIVGKLGPEPLDPSFTARDLATRLWGRRAPIKAVLLDQRCIAGLGNIYADEVLFAAGIDPRRPANSLTDTEVHRLHAAIRTILAEAIRAKGSTLRDYRPPTTGSGQFQAHLQVFRREGKPCPICGTPVQRVRLAQRSTFFCPHCQR
ncbi:MAG: bifunctional DNA-formamidopyrimidine glycosylase/DNA-(apurinic or apyrimidinic site) lyase [Anaerolineae bacterium]|nr:bifunctional DNA-formamidopyrimidine glycosylase/DNA-(apurinic or apyrimidinic site) lyase [Anaerolineae bacterium]